jgi:pyruvate kinase
MMFKVSDQPDMMTDAITIAPRDLDEYRPDALRDRLGTLRREIEEYAGMLLDEWRPALGASRFLPSAENLAHYLAFRRADLRDMQPGLQALGLSTLGRSEAHVMPSLDAVIASLACIAGLTGGQFPEAEAFAVGPATLLEKQSRIFGNDPAGPRTRIMVTLPSEAAQDARLLVALIGEGADCVRINCAHDDEHAWSAMIRHTRQAAKALGRDVRVLMDLAGPNAIVSRRSVHNRCFPGGQVPLTASHVIPSATRRSASGRNWPVDG